MYQPLKHSQTNEKIKLVRVILHHKLELIKHISIESKLFYGVSLTVSLSLFIYTQKNTSHKILWFSETTDNIFCTHE